MRKIFFAPSRVWSEYPVRAMEFIFGPCCNYVQKDLILDYKKITLKCSVIKKVLFSLFISALKRCDMKGRFQMQGGKNWILPK
jgi:hypothetical protein